MNQALRQVRSRIWCLVVLCLLFAGALVYRFYVVQILRHEELLAKAQSSYTSSRSQQKERGKILDVNGNTLVGNMPRITVTCSPYSVVEEPFLHLEKSLKAGVRERLPLLRESRRRRVAAIVAECFDLDENKVYADLEPWRERRSENGSVSRVKRHYIMIEKYAAKEMVEVFRQKMREADLHLGGFNFENIYIRHYPHGRMLSNIIGLAGLGGLESSESEFLEAQSSSETIQRSGKDQVLEYGDNHINQAGHDGDDIYLTIHEMIQAILEEELDRAQAEHEPWRIYAVVIDPSNGNILAISQRPNFDPVDRSTIRQDNFGNALAGNAYEPGSVMKPFFVAKALDMGVITQDTIIDCGNTGEWFGLKDPRGYGEQNPGYILKKSSNIGMGKLSLMMGADMVAQTLRDFRFGQRAMPIFSGESRGMLPRTPMRDLTTTRAAIGYAELVTVLQLARAYSALACGGVMPELRLLDRRRDGENGKMIEYPYPAEKQLFNNPGTAQTVTEMLISVTAPDGTGRRARIAGYDVAGKTGTAQIVQNGRFSDWYRASFCGFVPARNPRVLMAITIEGLPYSKPHGGGNVAAPVFQRVMSRVLRYLNVPPDYPEQLNRGR
ncbi:MAG: penicillin-binding protein 2 [Lentisphaeria bacterium]|nr:penicillin-binding protein 2 [Lentisphaeria bacterium]